MLIRLWLCLWCFMVSSALAAEEGDNAKHDGFQHTLGHIRPRSSPEVQAGAAKEVIRRILGDQSDKFSVSVDPKIGPIGKDTFKISKNPLGKIEIVGTSGVTSVWGFHYYLKHHCNSQIAWEGSHIEIPNTLPDVDITVTSNDRFRYYQNVCTAGYSTTWWKWEQWEKHIDWMALNGINLALAFHGQEAIWERVYSRLNLTRRDIDEHFGGPAFLPWARMGNIRGWGGPLPPAWHVHTVQLQHKILDRMRALGIIPVLPAFAGHVPRAFGRLFPGANLTASGPWNRFGEKYCCPYLLDPTDTLFKKVGSMYVKEYINEFGTDHVYNCDTFNENEPQKTDLEFLGDVGRAIYSSITDVDPEAIWVLQGWMFMDRHFWNERLVEAFLTSVSPGKMIVLDLQSEQFPQYSRFNSYYGQPFIWCMLHNFGGTLGMFGSADIINTRVFEGRNMKNSTMIGTGLTPEGINQNYVVYDLMNEMAYRKEPVDLSNWFQNYATRRYGAWNEYAIEAWQILKETVYSFTGLQKVRGKYVITRHPSIRIKPWTWYEYDTFMCAWDSLLKARYGRRNNTLYQHDVVDVTRQGLQITADTLYINIIKAFARKEVDAFQSNAALLMELFDDLEEILASSKDFLLGNWLHDAKSIATTWNEAEWYEYNARNQITLWGPNGEIRDYAGKQWSGIVADYIKPRWSVFLKALNDTVVNGAIFNATEVDERIFKLAEEPFTFATKIYPTIPQGDSVKIAVKLNEKWRKIKSNVLMSRRRYFPRVFQT